MKAKTLVAAIEINAQSDEDEVREYVGKHFHNVDLALETPLSAFGMMTAKEFAAEVGWREVMGTFRRMFG